MENNMEENDAIIDALMAIENANEDIATVTDKD